MMEDGGERAEEENRRLEWIKAYNDSRMGMKEKEEVEKMRNKSGIKGDEGHEREEKQEKYNRATYPGEIFRALEEVRRCSGLTDLTLGVENGVKLHAHAVVLAAVSTLVKKMLQKRHRGGEMFLPLGPEVSDLGLSAVLEFAYTGGITCLNKDISAQIQKAALCLGAPRVLELCKEKEERGRKKDKKKTESRNITAEEQMKDTLRSIKQLWEEGVGCDVELEAEGRAIQGMEK